MLCLQKSNLMVKRFSTKAKTMDFQAAFSVVQALVIFNAPSFISDNPEDRLSGLTFLTYIVQMARQMGLFKHGAEWNQAVEVEGWDTFSTCPEQELENRWQEWIRRETVRRCVARALRPSSRPVR